MTESPVKLPRQRARGFPVRDLKVRQMDALKDWLRAGPWTVPEAACLIAGVLPPERMGDTSDFGGVLPGREGWENAREAWREIVASEIRHLSALLQERVPSRATPQEFLVLAAQLDRNPPWLDAARADAEARALLPPGAVEGQAPARGTTPVREVASKGGKAKRDKDPQRAKFFPEVERLAAEGKSVVKIIAYLAETYSDPPPDKTVYGWNAELKKRRRTTAQNSEC